MNLQDKRGTGTPWVGEIPSHWDVLRIKRKFGLSSGTTPKSDEGNWGGEIVWVTPSDLGSLDGKYISETSRTLTSTGFESCGCRLYEPLNLVITKRGPIGNLVIPTVPFTVNQGCIVVETSDPESVEFVRYVLSIWTDLLEVLGNGTTFNELSTNTLSELEVPFPPLPEQRDIVSFLDEKTSLIDEIIEKKTKRIELLKELRSSLISEVVTKGLDPDVEMKDSGVEWIGEIPSHWTPTRMKFLVINEGGLQTGPFGGMITPKKLTKEGVKVFGQVNVLNGDFTRGHRFVNPDYFLSTLERYEMVPGDLVVTRKGSIGQVSLVPGDIPRGILDSDLIRIRPDTSRMNSEFLRRVLSESDYIQTQILRNSRGSVVGGLNTEVIGGLVILTPSVEEQVRIMEYLEQETTRTDRQIQIEEESVHLLRELRQSLISQVVTGKIDVRKEGGHEVH